MPPTEVDCEGMDLDWFAVDAAGHLVHLASGGGVLPASVVSSAENLARLQDYFKGLPALSTSVELRLASSASAGDLSSFLYYVSRGLFSFDRTELNNYIDPAYHLIARPPRALMLADVPPDIAALVSQTRLPFSVAALSSLSIAAVT